MRNKNMTFNVNGGQVSFARDNAIANVVQNNGVIVNELYDIIKNIIDNIYDLDK